MYSKTLLACLVIGMAIGCSKKTVKSTSSSEDTPPPKNQYSKADVGQSNRDRTKKSGGKANWVGDERFQKDSGAGDQADGGGLPGKPGWGLPKLPEIDAPAAPPAAAAAHPPIPAVGPGKPPPATPAITTPVAAGKPVAEADMKEIWVYIDTRSGASGQMPSALETLRALTAAGSKAAPLVNDGSIVLTGGRARESLWAYEKNALTQGGLIVSQNGVERVTAADLASRLNGR